MVTAGDFKNGVTFEMEGKVYSIIEFQHVKPGKGAAFVRTKIRDVINGSVVEKTFSPTDKFPTAFIERKEMEYSYEDGGLYYFMDQDYEQIPLSADQLGDALNNKSVYPVPEFHLLFLYHINEIYRFLCLFLLHPCYKKEYLL